MATDYDAPRRGAEEELETDSLEGLKAAEPESNGMDDDGEIVEAFQRTGRSPPRRRIYLRILLFGSVQ